MEPSASGTILITGATGFLGKHLVEQLSRETPGAHLRLLTRGASPWDHDPAFEVVWGDVTSAEDVRLAMRGAAQVYHLAGIVSRDPHDSHLYRVHVDGTRHICEAAREMRLEKIVVVSSSGTIAVGREPIEHDETSGYKNDIVAEWPYYLSKIFAEKLALSYAQQYSLPIVVVNPSLLLGPGDDRNSSTRDIALFLQGQIPTIPLGGLNFVDVRDVAAGLIKAMERGRPGERYLLAGPNWTFRELIDTVAAISGRHAPKMHLSVRASLAGARLLRTLYPLAGKRFELDDASIKMSALFWYCNSEKARREVGFVARNPKETLQETVDDVRRRLRL